METSSPTSAPCPGCERLQAEVGQLKKRLAELEARLEELSRTRKRPTAAFSKGEPKAKPHKPGRKAGGQHGQHAHRPPPVPEAIDETLEAPLPEACPHCGGPLCEDDDVDEQ